MTRPELMDLSYGLTYPCYQTLSKCSFKYEGVLIDMLQTILSMSWRSCNLISELAALSK
ncbi:unnamed protein product [Moneuplotes crassus]|uniref:Uncharacterized protein n=1 Tax=Euplotes crassus TaxID=5936 RepID=A0AAD2D9P5_EUPCR|nr:unnamed protein product [Moneuplotes crassus]